MMWPWKRRRIENERLDQIEKQLDETDAIVVAQQPRVNAITNWLAARRIQNGFGDDFEWTLAHPRGPRG